MSVKMKCIELPSAKFTTGLFTEEKSITWEIEGFHILRNHDSMIESQRITFDAGELDEPLTWTIFLKCGFDEGGKKWIGIFYKFHHKSKISRAVLVSQFSFAIKDVHGKSVFTGESLDDIINLAVCGGSGFAQMIAPNEYSQERLVIHIIYKMYLVPRGFKILSNPPPRLTNSVPGQSTKKVKIVQPQPWWKKLQDLIHEKTIHGETIIRIIILVFINSLLRIIGGVVGGVILPGRNA